MSPEAVEVLDDDGMPALLSVGDSGTAPQPEIDPGGGARPPEAVEPTSHGPQGLNVDRRRDAVVDAARTIASPTDAALHEFAVRRWRGARAITEADKQSFVRDVHEQRLHDLTDALHHRMTKARTPGLAGKSVRVEPPRAHVRTMLHELGDQAKARVVGRLRARGWTDGDIKKHVMRPYGAGEMPNVSPFD